MKSFMASPATIERKWYIQVLRLLCPWAHMSGLNILVRALLRYKREGTQRYMDRLT